MSRWEFSEEQLNLWKEKKTLLHAKLPYSTCPSKISSQKVLTWCQLESIGIVLNTDKIWLLSELHYFPSLLQIGWQE